MLSAPCSKRSVDLQNSISLRSNSNRPVELDMTRCSGVSQMTPLPRILPPRASPSMPPKWLSMHACKSAPAGASIVDILLPNIPLRNVSFDVFPSGLVLALRLPSLTAVHGVLGLLFSWRGVALPVGGGVPVEDLEWRGLSWTGVVSCGLEVSSCWTANFAGGGRLSVLVESLRNSFLRIIVGTGTGSSSPSESSAPSRTSP
mmetsp:Transcript_44183/g.116105  ORF Transcript_44183/g.116105 Transcript_44183/m.116105 type:complete len:202 (-) Transcript_44183:40-645(-)